MKKKRISAALVVAMTILAQSGVKADVPTLFIYHSGGVEPILISEIESINLTDLDSDGVRHSAVMFQEFCTADTVYRYHMGDIKKVSFEPPVTEARPKAIDLAGEMAQYIESVDYDNRTITLNTSELPEHLSLNWDNYLYQIEPSEKVPYGFAGAVSYVWDNTIYWYDCGLEDIFDSLALTKELEFETAPQQGPRYAPGNVPWYAAECHMPQQTVNIMTDELRDIPVGSAQPYVDCKIRVQPIISCQSGIFVLPASDADEKSVCMSRMHSAVKLNVEASASGRCILEDEESGNMGDGITLSSKPLGLGQRFTAKFKGSAKASGSMGLDYGYSASYNASALTTVMESDNVADASTAEVCRVLSVPEHTIDASFKGSLSLTGSLTLTVAKVTESLKSMSQIYTFGSSLSGDAFYKSSEIDDAHESNGLYERLTSSGVKATPVESVSAMVMYASDKIKNSNKIKATPATTFYAVPKFDNPTYTNGTLSYRIEGTPMKNVRSKLGTAVRSSGGAFTFTPSSSVWPGTLAFNTSPTFSIGSGDIVYPTATLQGKEILCSPSYPRSGSALTPVITTMHGAGVRIVSGWPYFSVGTGSSTTVIEGTPPGWLSGEKK